MAMDDFERELKIGFLEEAEAGLTDTEQCFLSLEINPGDIENLNKIFRLAHNLKGSSKAVGFAEMGDFTHEFETFILKVKNGELKATPLVVDLLLRCNDHLTKMVQALKIDIEAKFDSTNLLAEMKAASSGGSEPQLDAKVQSQGSSASNAHHHVPPAPGPAAIEPNLELLAELEAQGFLEPKEVPPAPRPPIQTQATAPAAHEHADTHHPDQHHHHQHGGKQQVVEETIRISLSKLENLLNYVGEMVILQSVLREQSLEVDSLLLKKTVHQLGKVGKEIQDLSMSLRMVPVKPTFQKMQRIVRDTAMALNKDVGIHLFGEATELDKTVLEKISDPLVHLIRNSVDHGIEMPEVRVAAGKTAKGHVRLSAFHESGKLVLEVKDDGGGLNPAKLKAKAIEKGIIKHDAVLTEKEAFNLIFAPGFSTKELVTDVSGRGVGMDVVRTNVVDLSGDISIDSVLGKGTTFRITLPLTLAIIDAMILTFGPEKFVLPLNHVHETLRPTPAQIQDSTGLGQILMLRGENMPIYRLGDFFGRKSKLATTAMIAIVIKNGSKFFAILVDDILGQYQLVVKQLGPELRHFKGVSGSTILGDGKPSLILEPADLFKRKIVSHGQAGLPAVQTLGGTAA